MQYNFARYGLFCLVFVLMSIQIMADDASTVPTTVTSTDAFPGQATTNQFLSAEVSRQMQQGQTNIITAVNQNNDDNFRAFDVRMAQFMADTKMKAVLAMIGASLVTVGIASFFMMRMMRNYSYEVYQEKLIKKHATQIETQASASTQGFQQMQSDQWQVQQPGNYLGMELGPAQAAQGSMMNAWQAQPAYGGAWQSPIQTQQEFSNMPYGHQEEPEERERIEDPMQSPGWSPQR